MSTTTATASNLRDINARAARRTLDTRRTRVVHQSMLFLVATIAITLVVLAHRDHQAIQNCHKRLEFIAGELQRIYAVQGALPGNLPMPGDLDERAFVRDPAREKRSTVRTHYAYFTTADLWADTNTPICACYREHHLWLRPNGRHVILYNPASQKFEIAWLSSGDFRQQAESLGLTKLLSAPH